MAGWDERGMGNLAAERHPPENSRNLKGDGRRRGVGGSRTANSPGACVDLKQRYFWFVHKLLLLVHRLHL